MTDNKDEIIVKEASDGSAIIDLPADLVEEEVPVQAGSQDDGSDEADDAAAAAEIAEGGAVDPEAEAMRSARRAKRKARKEYHKQVSAEKDVRLQNLQRQNGELMERLSALERKQTGSDLARIDKAIEDQKMRIQYGKTKMAEAAEAGDGNLLNAAEEMVYEARRQAEALEHFKRRSVQAPQQQPIQQDPQMQRYASEWVESHGDWYDQMGGNTDSKIALAVDASLIEEGWNPKTEEYWDELDKRLSKVLPHRYTDIIQERPQKSRPRSVVTGGGREAVSSGGKGTFTLNPDQVRAMKEAGMWDNPEKRARMIRRYAVEARKNGQRS
jgi:hypothetical protein